MSAEHGVKGLKPRPQRAHMESLIKTIAKQRELTSQDFEAIANDTQYSVQHVRRIARKLKIDGAPQPPKKAFVADILDPSKVETKITSSTDTIALTEKPPPSEWPLEKGLITSAQIASLFKSVNSLIPIKYRRDDEALNLLGSVWQKPLTRIFEEYADENVDIYIAVVTTIIVFSPVPVMYVNDKRDEAKQKELELITREGG